MALVVENGSQVAGANALVSLAECSQYHLDRGNAAWAAAISDGARESAIIQATDYLNGLSWTGFAITRDQYLCWPRNGCMNRNGWSILNNLVPQEVRAACCELALAALAAPLAPALDRGGKVASVSVEGVSVIYRPDAPAGKTYPQVQQLLRGLVLGSHTVKLVRA